MHGNAFGQRLAHQLVAGVGNERRPRIADECDPRAMLEAVDQLGPLARAVVVVVGDEWPRNP